MSNKRISKKTGKEVIDYIDNKELSKIIMEYVVLNNIHVEKTGKQLKIPDSIGDAIIKIANKYTSMHCYRGYTYRDEMIDDAIVACVKAIPKFDIKRSENPLAFLSQCCYYAVVNRINIEKREHSKKEDVLTDPSFSFFELGVNNENDVATKNNAIENYYKGKI